MTRNCSGGIAFGQGTFQSSRTLAGEVVAEFPHGGDGLRVDGRCGAATGTERLRLTRTVQAGQRLGHLAAVAVLDADEENSLPSFNARHGLDPLPIHGTIIDTCCR